jgi:chromosome partitioning protein
MTVVMIGNFKGGATKTTITCNLATGLAASGKRVGVIDTDPQGHCSHLLGVFDDSGKPYESLYTLITAEPRFRPSLEALTINIPIGNGSICLMPGGKLTATAAVLMEIQKKPIVTLRDLFQSMIDDCDVVLIDTPPTVGLLTPQLLVMSDFVFIPTDFASMDISGVDALVNTMAETAEYHRADILGIVPTKVHPREGEDKIQSSLLMKRYPGHVWEDTPIDYATAWKQAAGVSASIFELCKTPRHKPYRQMEAVLNKFADRVGLQ